MRTTFKPERFVFVSKKSLIDERCLFRRGGKTGIALLCSIKTGCVVNRA